MSSSKTYTANDIERYHRGELSAAEMHLLEKAALDDPMLADALEGYRHTANAGAELQALQNRLKQRIVNKPQRSIAVQPWLKIAALFVLLAGGGWLVIQTFSEKEYAPGRANGSIGTTTRENLNDSASTVQAIVPPITSDSLQQDQEVTAAGAKTSRGAAPQTGSTASAPFSATTDAKAVPKKNEVSAADDQQQKPEATTEITALKSNTPANTRRVAADTLRHAEDLAQQNKEMPEEVAASSRMQSAPAKTTGTVAAEPEGGWQAFNQYIAKNRNKVNGLKSKSAIDGFVELSFDVDKNGRPINIIVTKSLCESCDAEAIRLLKEGPKWKTVTTKAKVIVSF